MYQIAIFGTGYSSTRVMSALRKDQVHITCFLDSNPLKCGSSYQDTGIRILPPEAVLLEEVDYIINASIYPDGMTSTLLTLGVAPEHIISYFDLSREDLVRYADLFQFELVLYDLMDCRLNHMEERQQALSANLPYELCDRLQQGTLRLPSIMTMQETMEQLVGKLSSISRIGDGEFMLILGRSINFQRFSASLAKRLETIMSAQADHCMIAISDEFGSLDFFLQQRSIDEIRKFMTSHHTRRLLYERLNPDYRYGNAFITRPYMFLDTQEHAAYYFDSFQKLWYKKNVLIIEGESTCFGAGNNLLSGAAGCERIIVPALNAFDHYEAILYAARTWIDRHTMENSIILAAAGPTATVLAYDISALGVQILDVGHLDLEYEWYLRQVPEASVIPFKYCDALSDGRHPAALSDAEYQSQIIKRIK